MNNTQQFVSLGYFSGINEIDPPTSLTYEKKDTDEGVRAVYPLQVAENVWIDKTFHIHSRTQGQTSRLSGNVHSAWSDGVVFLYMLGDTLFSWSKYFVSTALVSGLTYGRRMSYASFNDKIYFSNGINIGYIKNNAAFTVPVPTVNFKVPLPAGDRIAYYRTRLYSAAGKVLYISDALSDCYDSRSGFRYFKKDIVMVRPVENGIYVADDQTWFLKGLAPEEMTRENVEDNTVIPYTDLNIDDLAAGTKKGAWAMWTSTEGICIGDGDGNVTEVTSHRFSLGDHVQGTAMIRDIEGNILYTNTMRQ